MITILHTGDWHYRAKWLEEIHKNASFVAGHAGEADIAILDGDLYDGPMPHDSGPVALAIEAVQAMANLAPVLAIRGTYTHDRGQMHLLGKIRANWPILVVDKPILVALIDGDLVPLPLGAEIPRGASLVVGCLPEPPRLLEREHADGMVQAICSGFRAASQGFPFVVAGHLGVTGSTLSNQSPLGQWVSRACLESAEAPVLLGHIHHPQKMANSQIIYCGSPSILDFGEVHEHGFYMHTMEHGGNGDAPAKWFSSTFVETPHRRVVEIGWETRPKEKPGIGPPYYVKGAKVQSSSPKACTKEGELFSADPSDIVDLISRVDCRDMLARVRVGIASPDPDLRPRIERALREVGAYDIKVDILRDEEVHVRFEDVAKARSLRDKIVAVRPETVPAILGKAEQLETIPEEKLMEEVANL
jgi:DNA repair exonuclease SbcCD nuclease subunit